MRYAKHILTLIFCTSLFLSCTVDELEPKKSSTGVQDVQSTDDGTNPPDDDKGNG
ncbi:hypothetical protein [Pontimicrobium aquaticum]|uniref:hypothetical protein n=1 Tax=Pontimicrobium aquaticum TaxID=2565367 RepID=UPI00145D896F|nr:hypothetical protein [Pontimicrobium aquaticum]